MGLIPIAFSFERENSLLSILTVTGKSKNEPEIEKIMISLAILLIEKVERELKGKLIDLIGHENTVKISEGMIAIRYYMIFKSDEDLIKAISSLKKGWK